MKKRFQISLRCTAYVMSHILCFLMLLLPLGAKAQSPAELFERTNYGGYLAHLQEELANITQVKVKPPLDKIARVAISIEKTHGWDGPSGKKTRELLKDAPDALRELDAMRLLLAEDPHGLAQLMQGTPPASTALLHVAGICREHGFAFAGNAIGVLTPDLPGKRILYLASIPPEKRPSVMNALLTQLKDPPNRIMLARTALDMFLRPPAGVDADPQAYYAIALTIGQGTSIVSFETAQQLSQGGKAPEATEMVTRLAAAQPADTVVQLRAAQFLRSLGNQAAAMATYRQALTTVPEPQRRAVRLDYLAYLQWQKKTDEIAKLQAGKDALLAGDAALVAARYDEAATQYAHLAGAAAPFEQRLAAWAGLLDADPAQALALGNALLPELEQADPAHRSALVAWAGRQF